MAAKEVTNDELARMIQEGFLSMKEEMHGRMDGMEGKVDQLRNDFEEHRTENRKEHADIRFKASETVSRVEHNQLKIRVETLETKTA